MEDGRLGFFRSPVTVMSSWSPKWKGIESMCKAISGFIVAVMRRVAKVIAIQVRLFISCINVEFDINCLTFLTISMHNSH